MFTVIGVTTEDFTNGDPSRRLTNALDEQMRLARPAGPALRVVAYAVDGTDADTLDGLRQRYAQHGAFHQFFYFNEAASQACHRFGIDLRALEVVNDQAVPVARAVLLDRLYVPPEV